MRKTINKLVRDNIPQILADSGINASFRVLGQSEYMEYLEKKLDEEVAEFHESKDVEELVDIMEVVTAIAAAKGCDIMNLRGKQSTKHITKGGFNNRILLIDMEEET